MESSLTDFRRPSFRYSTVDTRGNTLTVLPRVKSTEGQLERSQQAEIRTTGSIARVVADGASPNRIKVEYVLDRGLPSEQAWPLGTFFSASPVSNYDHRVASSTVDVYDALLVPRDDAIERPLHLPKGTKVTREVEYQLASSSVPSSGMAITHSLKTLRTSKAWSAGTTRLRIVNDLLDAIDYFAVYPDPMGVLRVEPHSEPALRPSKWTFRDGKDSIFIFPFTVDDDTYSVPNKVIGLSRADGTEDPLWAVASIEDRSSPFHFDNLGRWRTRVVKDLEVTDQADLQKRVNRLRDESSKVTRKVKVSHAWVPIDINDKVTFDCAGIKGDFIVINQQIPLDPKRLVTTTLKEAA